MLVYNLSNENLFPYGDVSLLLNMKPCSLYLRPNISKPLSSHPPVSSAVCFRFEIHRDLKFLLRILLLSDKSSAKEVRGWAISSLSKLSLSRHQKTQAFLSLFPRSLGFDSSFLSSSESSFLPFLRHFIFVVCQDRPVDVSHFLCRYPSIFRRFFFENERRILQWFSDFAREGESMHKHGALSLSQFFFTHRESHWCDLKWKEGRSYSPILLASRPHLFRQVDVVLTVCHVCKHIPSFWESEEFLSVMSPGEFLQQDYEFFVDEIMHLLLGNEFDKETKERIFENRNRGKSRDRDRGRSRDRSRDRSRERSRERIRDRSRERIIDKSRDRSRDRSRDSSRDSSRDRSRDMRRDRSRDMRKDTSRDRRRDRIRERIIGRRRDRSRDSRRGRSRDSSSSRSISRSSSSSSIKRRRSSSSTKERGHANDGKGTVKRRNHGEGEGETDSSRSNENDASKEGLEEKRQGSNSSARDRIRREREKAKDAKAMRISEDYYEGKEGSGRGKRERKGRTKEYEMDEEDTEGSGEYVLSKKGRNVNGGNIECYEKESKDEFCQLVRDYIKEEECSKLCTRLLHSLDDEGLFRFVSLFRRKEFRPLEREEKGKGKEEKGKVRRKEGEEVTLSFLFHTQWKKWNDFLLCNSLLCFSNQVQKKLQEKMEEEREEGEEIISLQVSELQKKVERFIHGNGVSRLDMAAEPKKDEKKLSYEKQEREEEKEEKDEFEMKVDCYGWDEMSHWEARRQKCVSDADLALRFFSMESFLLRLRLSLASAEPNAANSSYLESVMDKNEIKYSRVYSNTLQAYETSDIDASRSRKEERRSKRKKKRDRSRGKERTESDEDDSDEHGKTRKGKGKEKLRRKGDRRKVKYSDFDFDKNISSMKKAKGELNSILSPAKTAKDEGNAPKYGNENRPNRVSSLPLSPSPSPSPLSLSSMRSWGNSEGFEGWKTECDEFNLTCSQADLPSQLCSFALLHWLKWYREEKRKDFEQYKG